jgi:hypothetical protein
MSTYLNHRTRRDSGKQLALEWLEDRCVLSHGGGGLGNLLSQLQNFIGPALHGKHLSDLLSQLSGNQSSGDHHRGSDSSDGDLFQGHSHGHHGHQKASADTDHDNGDENDQKDGVVGSPTPHAPASNGPQVGVSLPSPSAAVSLSVTTSGTTGPVGASPRVANAGPESGSSTATQVEDSYGAHANEVAQSPDETPEDETIASLPPRAGGETTESAATRSVLTQADAFDGRQLAFRDRFARGNNNFEGGWITTSWFAPTDDSAPVSAPGSDAVFVSLADSRESAEAMAWTTLAPQASSRLLDIWNADIQVLDQALGSFLSRLDALGTSIGLPAIARSAALPWLVSGVAVTAAGESARRRLRAADGWTDVRRTALSNLGGPLPGLSF